MTSDETRAALTGAYEQYKWALSYATQRACTAAMDAFMANLTAHEQARDAEKDAEIARQWARAVMAEQHKVMDRMGRSSYQEVVEDKLRTELAEAQIAAEANALTPRDLALRAFADAMTPEMWRALRNAITSNGQYVAASRAWAALDTLRAALGKS